MIILLVILSCLLGFASDDDITYEDYQNISYIPEPMIFDLVRPLGSKKGQWEANTLLIQEHYPELSHSHESPELEYVVMDNLALELEIPGVGGEPDALKGVLQWTMGHLGNSNKTIHGVQLINQRFIQKDPYNEVTPIYILGHRFNREYTLLLMLGDQYRYSSTKHDHFLVFNATIFDVYSHVKEIEFGLENNILGFGNNFQFWRITPQIEVVLEDQWKIQTGFGTLYSYQYGWESSSSLRVIKEFY
ncbi:MAG: hypothetical protein AB7I27_18070 [Bacteriovoracaceae bacterium]